MKNTVYALIDAHERLEAATNQKDLWEAGLKIFRAVGSDFMTIGSAASGYVTAPIVRTNLPESLMDSYVAERIYLDDPWMRHCAISHRVDRLDVISGVSSGDLVIKSAMRELFQSHGQQSVTLFPGIGDGRATGVVLYAQFNDQADWQNSHEGESYARLMVALFTAKYKPEREDLKAARLYSFRQTLSVREHEVLRWVAYGFRTAQIADKMNIADVTVNKHFQSLRRKLRARTREQALAIALRDGLLSL